MIIKRSYVTLKKLYMTDPYSKEVLDDAFAVSGGTALGVPEHSDAVSAQRGLRHVWVGLGAGGIRRADCAGLLYHSSSQYEKLGLIHSVF